ncbi:hypothetical protein [uncultured Kordia sp.]|uniref:hypothetical protein n=1 Tax=uncultured Kordia sp. TaxID=507699 RepID=UPI0026395617|nr:hypothetical protein [uncultured Kordia sp.]
MSYKGNRFWELGISAISNEIQFKTETDQYFNKLSINKKTNQHWKRHYEELRRGSLFIVVQICSLKKQIATSLMFLAMTYHSTSNQQ